MINRTRALTCLTAGPFLCAWLAAVPAVAVDGVLEINPSCAAAGGCFPGDAPGFPVEVTQAGSYVLTGSLDLTSESVPVDATGILVSAAFVSIDLNGFSIIGPFDCSGGPPGAPGTGDGIRATASQTHVRNGTVRGVGRDGLSLGADARVDATTITCCGGDGVVTGDRARVSTSHVTQCGGSGLSLGQGSAYGGNQVAANGGKAVTGTSLVELGSNACDAGPFCQLDAPGTYTSSPQPSYNCAFGAVNYNVSSWTLTDQGGGVLQVTGAGLSPVLTGTLPTTTGEFSASVTIPGTCTEDYALDGTFLDADHWVGNFDATFTGGGGACVDCVDQSTALIGTRQ